VAPGLHVQLIPVAIGLVLVLSGATMVGLSALSGTLFSGKEIESQWGMEPNWKTLKPPITIELDLWHANGAPLEAPKIIPHYTGTGGPVYGVSADEALPLAVGTQLIWGGRVFDANGIPLTSVILGLFYFHVRAGCDETQNRLNGNQLRSCFTNPSMVYRIKTDSEGRFGYGIKLQTNDYGVSVWNLPEEAMGGTDVIVYVDFPTPILHSIFEDRVKTHYAIKLVASTLPYNVWIDDLKIIDDGRVLENSFSISNFVTFRFEANVVKLASVFLVVGKCGDRGCVETPPLQAMLTQELVIGYGTEQASFSREYDSGQYMFYLLADRADPFTKPAALAANSVFAFGIMNISPPIEHQLFGIVLIVGGLSLVASVPYRRFVERTKKSRLPG
jgi:hypothetical protein